MDNKKSEIKYFWSFPDLEVTLDDKVDLPEELILLNDDLVPIGYSRILVVQHGQVFSVNVESDSCDDLISDDFILSNKRSKGESKKSSVKCDYCEEKTVEQDGSFPGSVEKPTPKGLVTFDAKIKTSKVTVEVVVQDRKEIPKEEKHGSDCIKKETRTVQDLNEIYEEKRKDKEVIEKDKHISDSVKKDSQPSHEDKINIVQQEKIFIPSDLTDESTKQTQHLNNMDVDGFPKNSRSSKGEVKKIDNKIPVSVTNNEFVGSIVKEQLRNIDESLASDSKPLYRPFSLKIIEDEQTPRPFVTYQIVKIKPEQDGNLIENKITEETSPFMMKFTFNKVLQATPAEVGDGDFLEKNYGISTEVHYSHPYVTKSRQESKNVPLPLQTTHRGSDKGVQLPTSGQNEQGSIFNNKEVISSEIHQIEVKSVQNPDLLGPKQVEELSPSKIPLFSQEVLVDKGEKRSILKKNIEKLNDFSLHDKLDLQYDEYPFEDKILKLFVKPKSQRQTSVDKELNPESKCSLADFPHKYEEISLSPESFMEHPPYPAAPNKSDSLSSDSSFLSESDTNVSFCGYSTHLLLSGFVNYNYNTIREKRIEIENMCNDKYERILHLSQVRDDHYYMFKNTTLKEPPKMKKYCSGLMKNVITESANIILLKKIALSSFVGKFRSKSILIDGCICESIYEVGFRFVKQFRGENVTLVKVTRTIIFPNGDTVTAFSILSSSGQTVKLWWSDSTYKLVIHPKYFTKTSSIFHAPLSYTYFEKEDAKSLLFRRAKKNIIIYKKYLRDHPEVMHCIHRYLRNLILRKPRNVLPFTLCYFSGQSNLIKNA